MRKAGGITERNGAESALRALALAVVCSPRPSPGLLGAMLEAAHEAGRSFAQLGRRSGLARQTVARIVRGAPVTRGRARRALVSYARQLAGPLEDASMVALLPVTLADRLTNNVACALGWPPYPLEAPLPPAPAGLILRPPEHVLERVCLLAGITPRELRSPSRSSHVVAARVAVTRVLRGFGYSYSSIAEVVGRSAWTTLYYGRAGGAS